MTALEMLYSIDRHVLFEFKKLTLVTWSAKLGIILQVMNVEANKSLTGRNC